MTLVIDNFDSFTYNLVQLLGSLGQEVKVFRNNAISPDEAARLEPDYLIISPGPGTPDRAGVSVEMIKHFAGKLPILGVCLGHQAIAYAFGGKIVPAARLMHGKASEIQHDGKTVFSQLPPVFSAIRYHSLAVDESSLPPSFEISARSSDGEIMAMRHKEFEVEGLQFHPESVATEMGERIMANFLNRTQEGHRVSIKEVIAKVAEKQNLTEAEMRSTIELIMNGETTPAQIAAFLMALRSKGETVTEISAAASVLREKATRVAVPNGVTVVDTCGTGGDRAQTFNISTIAAFVAAGAGVVVAKHGNRSVSSRCGSADVLEQLGVDITVNSDTMSQCLGKAGISFLFAPTLHKAMKYVIGPRREIGVRTVFNILGPLASPAFAQAQVLGVYDRELLRPMAEVLKNLGSRRALVIHGCDGLDEITVTGVTHGAELKDGEVSETTIDPQEMGIARSPSEALTGGTVEENAIIALSILEGKEKGAKRDAVVVNAAAAIYISGRTADIASALPLAEAAIDDGSALKKLKQLIDLTHSQQ